MGKHRNHGDESRSYTKREMDMHAWEKAELRDRMPDVGDRVIEGMQIGVGSDCRKVAMKGTVIHVNERHLHYTVRFDNGMRQTIKMPQTA